MKTVDGGRTERLAVGELTLYKEVSSHLINLANFIIRKQHSRWIGKKDRSQRGIPEREKKETIPHCLAP